MYQCTNGTAGFIYYKALTACCSGKRVVDDLAERNVAAPKKTFNINFDGLI